MRKCRAGLAALSVLTMVRGVAVPATAAPDGSQIVINEVYGGGGNSGAEYTNDFVELFNPTDKEISLDGLYLQYTSTKGSTPNAGNILQLTGTAPAHGHFLIKLAAGKNGSTGFTADFTGEIAMGAKGGIVALTPAADPWAPGATVIDLVGWGDAVASEKAAAPASSNTVSIQRKETGVDTDDNSADFVTAAPTPQGTGADNGNGTPGSGESDNPGGDNSEPQEPPAKQVSINEIQGTTPTTPLAGQRVTTKGYVTASYAEGGFDGFYLQQGGETKQHSETDPSDAVFVWFGKDAADYPAVGACVTVTGTAKEYEGKVFSETQLADPEVSEGTDCGTQPTPVELTEIPAGDAAREAYEGMLVKITGSYTVSNNYDLNTFGTVGLAPGTEPFYQPTDVFPPSTDPNSDVQKLTREQLTKQVLLDDGRSRNYARTDKETPLPYIVTGGSTVKSLRTGDTVSFTQPVILGNRYDAWGLQPTAPVTGNTKAGELPITWDDSRAAEEHGPTVKDSELSLASFNVLNYFTSLGKNEKNCKAYTDKDGNNVTANWCTVRGAWSQEAFDRQQAKIVNAINTLDVSVLGLEEIENTATVTGDSSRRDESLLTLVDALNADLTKRGQKATWEAVRSPETVPGNEDVIRVAFIYKSDKVHPVGPSVIVDDPAYTGVARQPLAQAFARVGHDDTEFVAVVNHFKSKGSVARDDKDKGDGQGNNPTLRAEQAEALVSAVSAHKQWADKPIFLVGDLNSYTKEDTMKVLEDADYTNIATQFDAGHSYQFAGRIGSLDHAFGNAAAMKLVADADVWDINSDESIAFEYSRENYNVAKLVDNSVFRSSDHDPIKVAFNLTPTKPAPDNEPDAVGSNTSSDLPDEAVLALKIIGGIVGTIIGLLGIGVAAQQFAPGPFNDLMNQIKALLP